MRALVIDQNLDSRGVTVAALAELKASVTELAEVDRFVGVVGETKPDLIVADMGTVTVAQVREARQRAPSTNLVMTVAGELLRYLDLGGLLVVGATDFLVKPFDRIQILHRIRTLGELQPRLQLGIGPSAQGAGALLLALHDPASGRLSAAKVADFLDLPLKALAEGLGQKYRTVHKTPASAALQPELQPIRRTLELLLDLVGTQEAALAWLNTPSPDLSGATPLEVIRDGHADSVQALLENAALGMPA